MPASAQSTVESYSRAEQRAWYFYDWANSAFYTTVVAVMLGPYLTSLAKAAAGADGYVHPLGLSVPAESVWSYAISISVLSQVLALPLFGALADYGRRKREMLGALALAGAAATAAMFLLDGGRYLAGVALFLVANFVFGASIVVYNSFLPEIAPAGDRDAVSSKGWGLGYLGGGLLLAGNLVLFSNAASLGISEGLAVRICLASAGLWWALFTIIPYRGLHNRAPRKRLDHGRSLLPAALDQLRHTLGQVTRYPQTLLFLAAYLIYSDGIQTVIALAAQFGSEELHMGMEDLTKAILMVQFVAFAGALLFNRIAARLGSQRTVLLTLAIWAATLVYIYFEVHSVREFFIAAAVIGLVMGGSQALSRSLFSLMIPKGKEAEYYAVYEISDKGTAWLGPLMFGLALQTTHSFRVAILSMIVFFVAGMILLARVDVGRACLEAGNNRQNPS